MPVALLAVELLPRDFEARCEQGRIRHHDDVGLVAVLDLADYGALFVEQEGGHIDRDLRQHAPGLLLHALLFDEAQHGQSKRLNTADVTVTVTTRAGFMGMFPQRWTHPLAREFQQAKA